MSAHLTQREKDQRMAVLARRVANGLQELGGDPVLRVGEFRGVMGWELKRINAALGLARGTNKRVLTLAQEVHVHNAKLSDLDRQYFINALPNAVAALLPGATVA